MSYGGCEGQDQLLGSSSSSDSDSSSDSEGSDASESSDGSDSRSSSGSSTSDNCKPLTLLVPVSKPKGKARGRPKCSAKAKAKAKARPKSERQREMKSFSWALQRVETSSEDAWKELYKAAENHTAKEKKAEEKKAEEKTVEEDAEEQNSSRVRKFGDKIQLMDCLGQLSRLANYASEDSVGKLMRSMLKAMHIPERSKEHRGQTMTTIFRCSQMKDEGTVRGSNENEHKAIERLQSKYFDLSKPHVSVGDAVWFNGDVHRVQGFYDPSAARKNWKRPGKWMPLPLRAVNIKHILEGDVRVLLQGYNGAAWESVWLGKGKGKNNAKTKQFLLCLGPFATVSDIALRLIMHVKGGAHADGNGQGCLAPGPDIYGCVALLNWTTKAVTNRKAIAHHDLGKVVYTWLKDQKAGAIKVESCGRESGKWRILLGPP